MSRILRVLAVDSVRDLFKYKSFFILVLVIVLADQVLKRISPDKKAMLALPDMDQARVLADWVFTDLPHALVHALTDYRLALVLAGLFVYKQLISLWPSSDMRRMHRKERDGFGLLGSLVALKWGQLAWDAVAVGTLCVMLGLWMGTCYGACRLLWMARPSASWLFLLGACGFFALPLALAGFSYSSKLAVLSRGNFKEKLGLFFRLFTVPRVFFWSWVFYLFRVIVEAVFVGAIPALALTRISGFWLRIGLASLSATPVHSFLKMASFKFFLEMYADCPLVREEYREYLDRQNRPAGPSKNR